MKADVSNTVIFSTSTSDGKIYKTDIDYSTARESTTGTVSSTSTLSTVGQNYVYPNFQVQRTFLPFDTASIPNTATIDSAVLSIYVVNDYSDTDFNVTIQSGQPTYPHNPLVSSDYYYYWYDGDGGSRNTTEIVGAGYWNITLNYAGLDFIQKDATTKLCLRSSNDIDDVENSGLELIHFYAAEQGSSYAPKLYVNYTVSTEDLYSYNLYGPLQDSPVNTVYNGTVYVTIYQNYNDTETIMLDGTSGTLDLETVAYDHQPLFMVWNASSSLNYTRVMYFTDASTEDFYLFVPNADLAAYYYTFTITDFYGMTNPYLESTLIVNGSQSVVERRSLSVTGDIPFYMNQWQSYGLRFVCDQGTYSLDFLADNSFTHNVQVLAGAFPISNITLGLSAWCNRTSSTTIAIYYADDTDSTISLYMEISHRSGGTDILDYSSTTTGSSQSLTWSSGLESVDYDIYLEALRSDNTYIWHLQAASLQSTTNPFSGLLSGLGTWPKGFDPDQIPAAIIIVACLAIFSVYSATGGIILSLIIAAVLSILGFFVCGVTNLSFAAFVAVLAHLGESKKTEREV